jgi:gluconate 2-dehydrogenase gamma chain
MNRRDSLKVLGIGGLSATALMAGCTNKTANDRQEAAVEATGRQPFEVERDKALLKQTYFDKHEMATLVVLVDLIIPRDDHSGSATDAKVPDFIEYIVKDEPEHQLPMRGGLKWLDVYCLNSYDHAFIDCTVQQQKSVLEQIAYPARAKPEMLQGVAFFNKMRDLTAIGFFTSKMGIEDLGYKGNSPGKWDGVPEDVLKLYGLEGL